MAKKLTYTRPATLEGIAKNAAAERELERMHATFKRGEIVPESVWRAANAMLTERAMTMSFDSKRPYAVCSQEVLRRYPHLRLGCTPYMLDREFSGIEFKEAATNDDETTD